MTTALSPLWSRLLEQNKRIGLKNKKVEIEQMIEKKNFKNHVNTVDSHYKKMK